MSRQSSNIPSPPKHRRVTSGAHGGHPGFKVTGQSSQGAFSPGGAAQIT